MYNRDRFSLDYNMCKFLKECPNVTLTENEIISLNEDQKIKKADGIVTRLFNDIKGKILSADYAVIDKTKGDITKLENYKSIKNAINYLNQMKNKCSNNSFKESVNEIELAMANVEKLKHEFTRGYAVKNQFIVFMYCSTVLAIIESTSIIISRSVEYIQDSLSLVDAKVKDSAIIKSNYISCLKKFNDLAKNKKITKMVQVFTNKNEGLISDTVGLIGSVIGGVILVLTSVKWVVFAYYYSRIRIADHLRYVANFVELNASKKGNDAKKIKEKQLQYVEKLKKLADKIDVDAKVSEQKSNENIKDDNTGMDDSDLSNDEDDDFII